MKIPCTEDLGQRTERVACSECTKLRESLLPSVGCKNQKCSLTCTQPYASQEQAFSWDQSSCPSLPQVQILLTRKRASSSTGVFSPDPWTLGLVSGLGSYLSRQALLGHLLLFEAANFDRALYQRICRMQALRNCSGSNQIQN